MTTTSTEARFLGAGVALAGLLVASHVVSSAFVGVCALALAVLAIFAPGCARRFDLAAMAGVWGLVAAMFGLVGAGCFILAYALVAAAAALAPSSQTGLLVATTAVAITATSFAPAFSLLLGADWRITSEIICILSLGAPGLVLARIGSRDIDGWAFATARVQIVGPLFLLVVLGGAIGGLHGVAAAVACGWLAAPVVALFRLDDGDLRETARGLGVCAAGFVCAVVIVVARSVSLDAVPAIALGLLAGYIALRVHAPDVATTVHQIGDRITRRPATRVAPHAVRTPSGQLRPVAAPRSR